VGLFFVEWSATLIDELADAVPRCGWHRSTEAQLRLPHYCESEVVVHRSDAHEQ
jgi:hypothetical protein